MKFKNKNLAVVIELKGEMLDSALLAWSELEKKPFCKFRIIDVIFTTYNT